MLLRAFFLFGRGLFCTLRAAQALRFFEMVPQRRRRFNEVHRKVRVVDYFARREANGSVFLLLFLVRLIVLRDRYRAEASTG